MGLEDIKDRYINFYTDYAFKKFFGTEANKDLLIDFLNQLLSYGLNEKSDTIIDISYMPVEQFASIEHERKAVFDVFCKTEKEEYFMVEMQNAKQEYFIDRTIYYSTFPIREQAERNDWNFMLKKIYSVNILSFLLPQSFEGDVLKDGRYIKTVMLKDVATNEVFYDKLKYIFIEMPNFNKEIGKCETLFDKWLFAIKYLSKLKCQPEELKYAIFDKLFTLAEIAKLTREERFMYENSLNAMRDYRNTLDTAYDDGKKEGIEIGAKNERAANIRALGSLLSARQIAETLNLPLWEVEEILKNAK